MKKTGPAPYTYNVYDNSELIIENATLREISKKLEIPIGTIRQSAYRGHLARKRYRIKETEESKQEKLKCKNKDKEEFKKTKTEIEQFEERWEELCKPFRNVEWVKTGGRKLEFKR